MLLKRGSQEIRFRRSDRLVKRVLRANVVLWELPVDSGTQVDSVVIGSPAEGSTVGSAPLAITVQGFYTIASETIFQGLRARFNGGSWISETNLGSGSFSIPIAVTAAATGAIEVEFIGNDTIKDSVSVIVVATEPSPTPTPTPDPGVFTPIEPQGTSSKLVAPASSTSTSAIASTDFTQPFPVNIVEIEAPVVIQPDRPYSIAASSLTQDLQYFYWAESNQDLVTGSAPQQLTDGVRAGFAYQATVRGKAITAANTKHWLRTQNTATAIRGSITDFTLMLFATVSELSGLMALLGVSKQDSMGRSGIRYVTKPATEYTETNAPLIKNYSLRRYNP